MRWKIGKILNNCRNPMLEVFILTRNEVINLIRNKDNFSREDLRTVIREKDPNYNFNNLSSLLESYLQKNLIKKVDKDKYVVTSDKKLYTYKLSEKLKEIHDFLEEQYPLIKFQVWEFTQLNEFLNHLLANKTYVVEVESIFVESFFEVLKKKYNNVLLKPNSDDFYHYATWETIVVKNLVSESPTEIDTPHQIRLEKLLVDLVVDKFTSSLINNSEIYDIYEHCFNQYQIDGRKLMRYARRRNAQKKIKEILDKVKG